MNTNNFILNDIFKENAKVYQTKPVRATKYKPGMETGWVVYMQNKPEGDLENNLHEGVKFFETEQEALDYINADHKQYINKNGIFLEIEVMYETPMPVLHRKETHPSKNCYWRIGTYALLSDESLMYNFYILEPDSWIIQDADGTVRVWEHDNSAHYNESFFGKNDNYIYEKVTDNTYIKAVL